MHIIWINEYASFIGGCERYIANTVQLLAKKDVHSILLYNPLHATDSRFLNSFEAAFPIVDLKTQLQAISHDLIFVHQWFGNEVFALLADTEAPTIRFFHDFWLFCLRRHKMSLLTKKPCLRLAGCRCYPLLCAVVRNPKGRGIAINTLPQLRFAQHLNQKLDGFIVGSQSMKEEVIGNGFEENKTHLISLYAFNPSLEHFSIDKEKNLILFVGQLINGKGIDIAIKALKLTKHPYRLAIAGSGRQKKKYEALVKKLELTERVQFLGQLPYEKLEEWYARAACLVLPARAIETFGLVGIEAMRFGTPAIAVSLGGVSEWLEDGKTGISIPLENFHALAQALDKLWENDEWAKALGNNCKEAYRQKFQPEIHVNRLLSLFHEEIAKKKNKGWGRLTFKGPVELEQKITLLLQEVKDTVKSHFPQSSYHALLLIGGYGKGEGGFELKEGVAFAHNNLDFLLITQSFPKSKLENMRKELAALLFPISQKYDIGFDLSVVSNQKLKQSENLLIWHEMYHGHKLLLGESRFIASLPFKEFNTVPSTEFWSLMINRGTLLIINQWFLDQRKEGDPLVRKIFIKHMMKAIIGLGDALLYFLHDYHWSYEEKLSRIKKNEHLPSELRVLYEEAAEFRFQPIYDKYLNRNLHDWMKKVCHLFSTIYLQIESLRLKDIDLNWNNYVDRALISSLKGNIFSLKTWKNKVNGLLHPPKASLGTNLYAHCGFLLLPPKQRLAVMFPFIAFAIEDVKINHQIQKILSAKSSNFEDLRFAYLRAWSMNGDINFKRSLKEWGLDLA